MKKGIVYPVNVELRKDGRISSASCNCVRGQGKCGHMAALLLHAHHLLSPTDVECRWSKKKTPKDEAVHPVASFSRRKKFAPGYTAVDRTVLENLEKDLCECPGKSATGVLFLLKAEPEQASTAPQPLDSFRTLDAEDAIRIGEAEDVLRQRLSVSWDEVVETARCTVGQSFNPEWARVRRCRLTASKFGAILRVMKARGGRGPTEAFLRSLVVHQNLDGVRPIQWGRTHEKTALNLFSSETGRAVVPTGVWLHTNGFLGASPDGLIDQDCVIEVKCPYAFRGKRLKEVLAVSSESRKKTYAVFYQDGQWNVDINHEYYHQLQAAIYFTRCGPSKTTCSARFRRTKNGNETL